MNFFAIDQHISGMSDLEQIFAAFGHTITWACQSGHARIIGRGKDSIPLLDGDNWCNVCHDNAWSKFYDEYKDDLDKFDGFVSFYPPIFARLFERWNKPTIIQIPIRYECGVDSNAEQWGEWNDFLVSGIDSGRVQLCANSLYDAEYTSSFIDRPIEHIPNYCEYTRIKYSPSINHILYYASFRDQALSQSFIRKYEILPFGHSWQDLGTFKAIMHYPYNISTMSIFEQYTANIPLMFPTIGLLMDMYEKKINVLNQISWNKTYDKKPGSTIKCNSVFDPNRYDDYASVKYWLKYADYYNESWMPHIIYFDSIYELNEIAKRLTPYDYQAISDRMKRTNEWRKAEIYRKWSEVFNRVEKWR